METREIILGMLISIGVNLIKDFSHFTLHQNQFGIDSKPPYQTEFIGRSTITPSYYKFNFHSFNFSDSSNSAKGANKVQIQLKLSDSSKKVLPSRKNTKLGPGKPNSIDGENNEIWFITATSFHTVQRPVLIRMAQALFPCRHFLTWVIVQDTKSIEKEKTIQIKKQFKQLHNLLQRFGIPYLLLDSRMYNVWKRMKEGKWKEGQERKKWELSARQTGLIWVLENVERGTILLADIEFAFDHRIFFEIRGTRRLSVWPVGLGRTLGLSSPIVVNGMVTGYHDGLRLHNQSVIMDLSSFAVNISFIRHSIVTEDLWKLTYDGKYAMDSIGIQLKDIQPLARNCTKILVWRTYTYVPILPRKVIFNQTKWKGTNVERILRNLYGFKYSSIIRTSSGNTSY